MTVSLETAKKLKEAGWKQNDESDFCYAKKMVCEYHGKMPQGAFECSQSAREFSCEEWKKNEPVLIQRNCSCWYDGDCIHDTDNAIQAQTTDELLEALPKWIEDGFERTLTLSPRNTVDGQDWCASYEPKARQLDRLCANYGITPAEALAFLWLELKSKKLI